MRIRAGRWIILAAVVAACSGPRAEPVANNNYRKLPADQVIVGFEQYVTEAGAKRAIMLGDTAYIFEDSSMAKVHNAKLTLYDENGKVSARLTSKTGDVNTATKGMIARGNVVLITDDGGQVETEELHYDPENHRVWSNMHTVQRRNGSVLSGSGFEADDKFQNVRITNASSRGGGLKIQF